MQNQKIILETNFTDPYENDPQLKFLLVDELHHGIHFSFISKWKDNTGIEGGVETYFDFEKALKKFIQRVDKERKQGINHKNLKIIAPNQFEILDTIQRKTLIGEQHGTTPFRLDAIIFSQPKTNRNRFG